MGFNRATKPITSKMFVMLEPSAFPTEVSKRPWAAAVADTSISGADEPMATIVRPIIIGEMPLLRATDEAPNTKRSALHINKTKPTITKMMANNRGDIIVSGFRLTMKKGIFPLLASNCKKTSAQHALPEAIRFSAYFVTNFCNDLPAVSVYNNTTLWRDFNCKHTWMYIMMLTIATLVDANVLFG